MALICLPLFMAKPTPPICRCMDVALSPNMPYPYIPNKAW